MLFTVIGLFLFSILYFVYLRIKKMKKFLKFLLVFLLCISFISSVISFAQNIYIEKNFFDINAIVTFDEDDYPVTHFVNLYKSTTTEKIYEIKNYCGFYVFKEIKLSEHVLPVIVSKHNSNQDYDGVLLYEYS